MDLLTKAFLEWANGKGYGTAHAYNQNESRWMFLSPMTADVHEAWQACAARMVPLHAEQIRVAAVAAIREVTGCPDIKGRDGAYLVDALIVNLLSAAPEGNK